MADQTQDRTEQPTAKRRREARDRGQIARSRELTLALGSLGVTGALAMFGPIMVGRLASAVAGGLSAGRIDHDLRPEDVTSLVLSTGASFGIVVAPIAAVAALTAIASGAAQTGLHVTPAALRINWGRLSPANGVKRFAPSQAGVDTLRAILTAAALAAIAWPLLRDLTGDAVRYAGMGASVAAGAGWAVADRLLWRAGFLLLALGAADYAVQRWRITSSLKMTKQEVKDEARLNDGNPEIKARVRRLQREMSRRRMLKAAATATVVITNPTHYAVALEYRREKNPAPIVVAKGADLVAAKIREIARTNGVPIVENPPLARALHAQAEVGQTIPADLFGAVAEVLAYLIRIKQLML